MLRPLGIALDLHTALFKPYFFMFEPMCFKSPVARGREDSGSDRRNCLDRAVAVFGETAHTLSEEVREAMPC